MTSNWLEERLIQEIEEVCSGLYLKGVNGERKALKGYMEALPQLSLPEKWDEEASNSLGDTEPEDALIPYFIVRTPELSYMEDGAQAKVYLVFCIYDSDEKMKGYQALWNILNRITGRFRSNTVLDAFFCSREMKAVIQDEDTYPYYFGGIEMIWHLPDWECEEMNNE